MTDVDEPATPPPPPPPSPAPSPTPTGALDLAFVEELSRGRPPHFPTAWAWIGAGIRRQRRAAVVALLAAWSGLWLVLWLAVLGAVIGAVVGLSSSVNISAATVGAGQAVGILSILGGFFGGAAFGCYAALYLVVFNQPLQLIVALLSGVIVSAVILGVMIAAEPLTLKLRGYRRMSRRERERLVPLLEGAAQRLGLRSVPAVLIADDGTRNAYTCLRHLVVSRPLYDELADEPLAAILAHELHHWATADVLGARFVFACAWPLAILFNAGSWLARWNHGFVRLLGWVILWPAFVLTKFLVEPVMSAQSRRSEYECDAAAKAAGYGPALHQALTYLGDFEGGRSGWEQVIAATHPPRELRLEALESVP